MGSYTLILGDCLDVLPTLEAGSVDAVVSDPPYGQSNEKYDKGVDPAVWRECFRVARPNAALLSFAGNPTYHRIAAGIEAAGWRVRQMWAWVYQDGMMTSAYPKEGYDRLSPSFDPICYATKGKVLLNLRREGAPWSRPNRPAAGYSARSVGRNGALSAAGHWPRTIASDGANPFEYFALARTGGGRTEKSGHPNQKPLALMRWLLDKLPPGGTVLDPFMGSGSTGLACLQTGRDFIGIEKSPEYHTIGQRRLAEAREAGWGTAAAPAEMCREEAHHESHE